MSQTLTATPDAATTPNGRARRLSLIAALYCTQNLSLGFFTYAFLTIAQGRGVPLAAIGSAMGVAMVLTLKFLWAPLVDRFGSRRFGHYRSWLLVTQTILGLGVASLALFDPAKDFPVLLGFFTALFLTAATQDIAADATATRLLPPSERGVGNGFQTAGSAVAQVVGGGLVLVIYHSAGWQVATLTLAVFSLLPLPFILGWREQPSAGGRAEPQITLRSSLSFFSNRAARWWSLVLIPAYTLGFTVAFNLLRPILIDAGWDAGRIGLFVVIGGSGAGITSGVTAGYVVSWLGRRRALIWLGALQVAATLGVLPIALGATAEWFVLCIVALSSGAFCAAFAIVYTISMDLTRPESPGTDFTWFTTIGTIAMVLAAGSGVAASGAFGFVPVLLVAGVLALLGLLFTVSQLDRVLPREARAPHSPGTPLGR